jgi:RNA polymerase-binding transcription factor DksA
MSKLTASDIELLENRLRNRRGHAVDEVLARLEGYSASERAAMMRHFEHPAPDGAEAPPDLHDGLRAAWRYVAEIDAALRRIDYGVVGVCTACGGCIQRERLQEDPTTRTCGPCHSRMQASA